jgi:coenzyme F420-dependent glucose-6-phosphate dehydrogenase
MITVGASADEFNTILTAFRDGGGRGKPVKVQASLAWAQSDDAARRAVHEQWAGNVLGKELLANLRTPKEFEAAAQFTSIEDVCARMPVSSDLALHLDRLQQYIELGVDDVYLFNVTPYQREFIEAFGERVLPHLRAGKPA